MTEPRRVRRKNDPTTSAEVLGEHGGALWLLDAVAGPFTSLAKDWEDVLPSLVWAFGDLVTHPEHGLGVVVDLARTRVGCRFPHGEYEVVPADSLTAAPREPQGMRQIGVAVQDFSGNPMFVPHHMESEVEGSVPVYVADPDAPPLQPVPEGSVVVDVAELVAELCGKKWSMVDEITVAAALKAAQS